MKNVLAPRGLMHHSMKKSFSNISHVVCKLDGFILQSRIRHHSQLLFRGTTQTLYKNVWLNVFYQSRRLNMHWFFFTLERTLVMHWCLERRESFQNSISALWRSEYMSWFPSAGHYRLHLEFVFEPSGSPLSAYGHAWGGGSKLKRTRNVIFMSPRCPNMKCHI